MRMIGRYYEDDIDPCPGSMRNTMLVVAALLHLEEALIDEASSGKTRIEFDSLNEAFVAVARRQMDAVVQEYEGRPSTSSTVAAAGPIS